MATKYNLFIDGTQVTEATRAKKDAVIKIGDATGKSYTVCTTSGNVVHEHREPAKAEPVVEEEIDMNEGTEFAENHPLVKPEETPAETEEDFLFYEQTDFPGNYSIVTAPLAVEIAEAAGVAAKIETTPGKLTRRVYFGGLDVDRAKAVKELVDSTVADTLVALREWQKANIEKRRDLTDMQKFLQHREFIAKTGTKVAKQVKKGELL